MPPLVRANVPPQIAQTPRPADGVIITVMTAALVLAILIPFREAIVAAVTNALTSVTSGG